MTGEEPAGRRVTGEETAASTRMTGEETAGRRVTAEDTVGAGA